MEFELQDQLKAAFEGTTSPPGTMQRTVRQAGVAGGRHGVGFAALLIQCLHNKEVYSSCPHCARGGGVPTACEADDLPSRWENARWSNMLERFATAPRVMFGAAAWDKACTGRARTRQHGLSWKRSSVAQVCQQKVEDRTLAAKETGHVRVGTHPI